MAVLGFGYCQERGQKRDSGTWPPLQGQRALVREPRVPLCPTQTCGSGRPFTEPWGDWARPHPSLCSAVSPAPSGQTPHRPRLEGQRCPAWGQGPARDTGQAEGRPWLSERGTCGHDSGKDSLQLSEPPFRGQHGVALPFTRRSVAHVGLLPSVLPAVLTPVSGFLAGVCGVAVGYPLDTVKVP